MSFACLILGESGTGKTASLRNFNPAKTLLIQPIRKPLPFRAAGWTEIHGKNTGGNIYVSADPTKILLTMQRAPHPIIVLDDWQYVLAAMFMAKRNVKGYDKFSEIGAAGYDLALAASQLPLHKRVYILSHTETDDYGVTRIKTLGRMLSEKIVVEGMFTTVLRTEVDAGRYFFRTHNNGSDTVKSPLGMFEDDRIENDLAAVDARICEYYGITETDAAEEPNNEPKTE